MQDRADKNNSRDRDSEDLSEKFTLEFTKEEGMLLLTSARLLDKLVAGVTIHARERDELIKEIIEKLADQVPQDVARVSAELADAIVDSVLGCDELDDDYAFADALAMNMPDSDPDADSDSDSDNGHDYRSLRRSIMDESLDDSGHFDSFLTDASQVEFPMYATDQTLPVLEHALINHLSVRAQYYSFARESVDTVTLNPFMMIKEQDNWRMVAFCHERSEVLLFRVDRIKSIDQTALSFEPKDVGSMTYTRLPVYS
jgi:predicted DNA-binding transcriptional regulator YafY